MCRSIGQSHYQDSRCYSEARNNRSMQCQGNAQAMGSSMGKLQWHQRGDSVLSSESGAQAGVFYVPTGGGL